MAEYRLPDGRVPVLLSSDSVDGLRAEAAAVRGYLLEHPEVSAERLADMLFRTRVPRRRRALILAAAGAAGNDELSAALDAIATDADHPSVVRGDVAASARRVGFVFPGQGSQRPGMGSLFYQQSAAYRAVVDECAALHEERFGHSQPLHYLLGHEGQYEDTVWEVQPALMFHMTGLAAVWRAAGVEPSATVGHSQGELAAGAVSGVMTLRDSVLAVTHRALLADRLSPRGYSMAVFGMDRESVEALMARHSGWAELAVVNSPHIIAISGERGAVIDLVEAATARGQFAREIRVAFPAHTSIVAEVRSDFEGFLGDEMSATNFAPTEIPCYGATLGEPITPDLKQEEYWFWNLRNRVRFDRAVVNAGSDGVDLMIEVAEHPILQLALQENLSQVPARPGLPPRDFRVLGTSLRTAEDLSEFTRNLAQVAVLDLGYRWDALRVDDSVTLPLRDFPHTITAPKRLWAPLGTRETPAELVVDAPKSQRLVEEWTPLQRRTLTAPRSLLIVDPTGDCAEQATALVAAADRHGAEARSLGPAGLDALDQRADAARPGGGSAIGSRSDGDPVAAPGMPRENAAAGTGFADTVIILVPVGVDDGVREAIDALTRFYAERPWAAALSALRPGGECWLITVGGEAVRDSDPLPGLFQSGVAAGFRSVGIEHPGTRFRHLDLAAGEPVVSQAAKIVGAVHSTGEAELALRSGKLFVKRLVPDAAAETGSLGTDLDHVVIIGGTGKLGLRFTEHLARTGAGRITLLSRSGETEELAGELARLRRLGNTEIVVRACDVSDADAAKAFGAEIADRPADLVIHAAVNYVDAELGAITAADVRTAAAAKLRGLDNLVDTVPLTTDARVLLCSSMAATIGGRGQILYAVTNRMLDVAARRLRARGIAAASLQWGLWSVAGPLDDAGFARVEEAGVYPMVPADAIAAGLAEPIRDGMIIAADWDFLREVLGAFGQESLITGLESTVPAQQANTSRPAASSRVAVEAERAAVNEAVAPSGSDTVPLDLRMRTELLKVIGGDSTESIDATMPLVALGLDSLQALDFRKRVKAELDRDLPVAAILGGASLDDVVLLMAQNTNQG
ncbi:putative polyketide synthase MbtD [Nocardia neocaledoniensis NBRC 108232]|uniref:Mycobactin polyketide synthetase MbtD n=1 Tax=Nocardia neocaledoniensis TaxID=236511 RepID=A0A317NR22_9NOCA|nr:SDR family NAD(P)-dependent oxidoreductase [Nocardia neocaledoniensis]PWV77771.1 mycobactin polyketide synthetase MbtD [Nocardia neocaledoniensis]GEM31083.1 putative polyketide synthase MbtD [Nocardia neocaledoniensis NBRC 108232]